VTNKTGFGFDDKIQLVTTVYKSLSATLSSSDFQLNWTELHYSIVLPHTPLYSVLLRTPIKSESFVTTDGQPASLPWSKAPIWGLRPDLCYLRDSCDLVLVGRPLWRGVGFVFCMCCWPLPAQSFSGPGPLGASHQISWLCPFIIPRDGPHLKHRLLLSRIRVYWSVTYQWMSCCWERNFGNVFTEPLPSNGRMRHSIKIPV
jgi:hypothetical protein